MKITKQFMKFLLYCRYSHLIELKVSLLRPSTGVIMPKRKRSTEKSKLEGNRVKCGHCHIFLSKRQYHEHKRQFFNALTGTWNVEGDVVQLDVHGSSSSEGGCNLKL